MFRWIKLFGDWYIGFWVVGLFSICIAGNPVYAHAAFQVEK